MGLVDCIFDISSDINKNVDLFNSVEKGAGDRLLSYLDDAKIKYEFANKLVLNKSVDRFFEFFSPGLVLNSIKLNIFTNLDKHVRKYFSGCWERRKMAPSAFIMYIGVNRRLDGLAHHNYFFRKDWSSHFKSVFESPSWEENPNFYLCAPSRTDGSVAPYGCENLFLLVPLSPGLEDTQELRQRYREKMLDMLNDFVGFDISKNIIFERVFSLNDFANDYNAYKGTALGLSLNFGQTGYFRPHNKSKKVKNLYYVGQYTHPGCGMAPCIISGKNVANDILGCFNDE